MEINRIQQNYGQTTRSLRKANKAPNFTGTPASTLPKLGEEITKLLPGQKAIGRMKSFEWLKGEIGGILLTAFGTGLVAPIFIGTNPFVKAPKGASKEEKQEVQNTKWYTAMRQPISAALAILFQVSALKPIDKFLDKKFNIQKNAQHMDLHLDQSVLNGSSYRKTVVKKAFKLQGIAKPSIFGIFTKGWKTTMAERKAYNVAFKNAVDKMGEDQLEAVAKDFGATGIIHVGKRKMDAPTMAELVNSQIDDYIADAKKLKINDKGLTYYTKRAKLLVGNEAHLREIFKNLPEDEKDVTAFVKNLIENEQNPEIKKDILEDILKKPEDLRANRIKRTLERIDSIKNMCGGVYSEDNYLTAMSQRNGELDRIITKLHLNRIADPQNANDGIIKRTVEKLAETCRFDESDNLLKSILHDADTFNFDKEKLLQKINKDIAKAYKKLIENKYKGFNQITKVAVGACITLPITCTALNWVYPRFMELFFPKLAGVKTDNAEKKPEGGDK
jgi:hypothetical protein